MPDLRRFARATALCAALALPLGACATGGTSSPPTAAQQRQEAAQGRAFLANLRQNDKVVEDAAAQSYLDGLLARIQRQRAPGSAPLRGTIVADADVNAFTTGGGYVFVNAGLMGAMENEAQLAMVLSHEVAHVDLGHVTSGRQTQQTVGILGAIAGIGLSAAGVPSGVVNPLVGVGSQTVVSSFSREQEREADRIGARTMLAAGWDLREGARSFEVLRRLYGNGGGFLSSHPASADRQQELTAAAGGAQGGEIGQQRHLRATARLRREVLAAVAKAEGRGAEAAQLRRNIAATR